MSFNSIRILKILSEQDAASELTKVGVDPQGIEIMAGKMRHLNIKIKNLELTQANIIKQEMLTVGADAAVHKKVITNQIDRTDAIIMATEKQILRAVKKLKIQPFGLKIIADELRAIVDLETFGLKPMLCGKRVFDFAERPYVMGILNVTPDSFSDGGRFSNIVEALKHAESMIADGADIIDVGGESTRPGAATVSLEEELSRVIPIIREIKKKFDIPVSVDTYKSEVARQAIDVGADIINDISALRFDPKMKQVAADADVPVILMHIKGTPKDMQTAPIYGCVISDIFDYLKCFIQDAVSAGIKEDKIIIDPGIGFGKTLLHNITIIKKLDEFKSLRKPILIGLSRKSMIGSLIDGKPDERLFGTIAANVVSVMNGANILRVHDVKENVEAIKTAQALM